jgi:hypothetical protein
VAQVEMRDTAPVHLAKRRLQPPQEFRGNSSHEPSRHVLTGTVLDGARFRPGGARGSTEGAGS